MKVYQYDSSCCSIINDSIGSGINVGRFKKVEVILVVRIIPFVVMVM